MQYRNLFFCLLLMLPGALQLQAQSEAESASVMEFQNKEAENRKRSLRIGERVRFPHKDPPVMLKGTVTGMTDSTITVVRSLDDGVSELRLDQLESISMVNRERKTVGGILLAISGVLAILAGVMLIVALSSFGYAGIGLIIFAVLSIPVTAILFLIGIILLATSSDRIRLREWRWKLKRQQ